MVENQGQRDGRWKIQGVSLVGSVAGISPCYRGRNGSLPSIRQKGRFLRVENAERKMKQTESKEQEKMAVSPSANKVRASPWLPANNY